MSRSIRIPLLAFCVLTVIAGCRRTPPAQPPAPAPPPAAGDNDAERARLERERLERERLERERAEREAAERARLAEIERVLSAPIYFGFDRFDLTAESRASLEQKWTLMNANPALRLLIEGHTDDTGSDEYNLALGMQRAAAAKRFFTQRDIADARIEIVSFGEERPTCGDEAESCRSRNRRAEFRITAGLSAGTGAGGR